MIRYLNNPFNKERDLFEALKKNLVPDLEKAQDQFSKYDKFDTIWRLGIPIK